MSIVRLIAQLNDPSERERVRTLLEDNGIPVFQQRGIRAEPAVDLGRLIEVEIEVTTELGVDVSVVDVVSVTLWSEVAPRIRCSRKVVEDFTK